MAQYLIAADAGRAPDVADFLARYPDLRPDLEAFMADQAGLARLVQPIRGPQAQPGGPASEATLAAIEAGSPAILTPTAATPDADEPASTVGAAGGATDERPEPGRIRYFGDYELLKELGRGGMGVVYRARQVSLNRPVALKMIKAGILAGDDELRRFQNEAEAVALLDHPGIVPIHEVGEYDGQRYFSMKLIRGGSLVERLASHKADPKATAALLAEVAEAVHHAHIRGILHRDLKPANILIDDQGHAHVTDFGLARKVEGDSEITASGAILGTPSYMAPEQAGGSRGSITTATDVYGLGSVLYALLTGRAPFVGAGVVDTLTMVKERPPESPRKLNAKVPRDLEVICLKCLEKDPRRRYASAQAVAEDLRAWLESRPIVARPVGAATRLRLWCKRRPAVAALSAAVVLTVVGGTAAVIVVQARANAELRAANVRERARFELAMQAIKTFHTGVSEDFLLKEEQFKAVRDRLLKSASDFYGRLGALLGKESDPASRRALGQANYEAAELTVQVAQKEAALAAHRRVLAYRESLAGEPGASAEIQADVGRSLTAVAGLLVETGRTDEALAAYRKGESLLAELSRTEPAAARATLAKCRMGLSICLAWFGRIEECQAVLRLARADLEALPAFESDRADSRADLAQVIIYMGFLMQRIGHPAEALAEFRAGLAIRQELADDQPAVTQFQGDLAAIRSTIGWLLMDTGHPVEAQANYSAAQAIWQVLADDQPGVTQFRSDRAAAHSNIGYGLYDTGHLTEALQEYRAALAIQQKLADDHPAVVQFRYALARTHHSIAIRLARTGRPAEAMDSYRRELAIFERLVEQHPGLPLHRNQLGNAANDAAGALMALGRTDEARALCERAMAIYEALVQADPQNTDHPARLAESLMRMGQVRRAEGAAAGWRRAAAIYAGLSLRRPEVRVHEACCHAGLAGLAGVAGSGVPAAEGRDQAETAMDLLRQAVAMGVRDLGWLRTDALLEPLRDRPDFQMLLMDLALPADPFAPRPEDQALVSIRP